MAKRKLRIARRLLPLPSTAHLPAEINVDLFAGGGGVSEGARAGGAPMHVALNHNPVALAVHRANHPETVHLEADVWEAKPREITAGRRVRFLWLSPDCTHFSTAKGAVPKSQAIRSLAWVGVRWARQVAPDVIMLENVREFLTWGPLDPRTGKPNKAKTGITFRRWCGHLRALGYVLEHRVLDASLYGGAPTRRKRLFIVARRDGLPIVWPAPTHGPGLLPLHTAAECIDWSIPCPSIFGRKRPLAQKTLWRIAQGLRRFVFNNPTPFVVRYNGGRFRGQSPDEPFSNRFGVVDPFVVKVNHGGGDARGESLQQPLSTVTASRRGHALVMPVLQQSGQGERVGQQARLFDLDKPLTTVVAGGQKHALVSAFLNKHYNGPRPSIGSELVEPLATVTATDHHSLAAVALAKFRGTNPSQPGSGSVEEPLPTISGGGIHVGEVRAFLSAYYGSDGTGGQRLTEPMRTVTAADRLGLVTVEGVDYQIVDIGFRMLEPHELLRAQFGKYAASYDISAAKTKRDQVRLIGNSVPPELVEAVVRANRPRSKARAA